MTGILWLLWRATKRALTALVVLVWALVIAWVMIDLGFSLAGRF